MVSRISTRGALKKVPLFSGLDDDDLASVEKLVVTRRYTRAENIFFQGEEGEAMFVVVSGRVRIYRSSRNGREQTMEILGPGDPFGAVVLIDGQPYPASAEALEDSQIGVLRRQDLDNLLLSHPQITLSILRILAARLREAKEQLSDLALKDVRQRTAVVLLQLAERHGQKVGPEMDLVVSMTHQELAQLIGASRETVTRVLGEFRQRGAVTTDGRMITITDPGALKSWSRT